MRSPLTRLAGRLPALGHPEFRRYFAAQAFSVIGVWMQMVALSWLVYELTGSPARLGIFGALRMLPVLLLGPLAGGVADRHSRRNVLLATQVGMTGVALVLAVLHLRGLLTYPVILTLAVLQGAIFAFDIPSRHALVAELVGRREMANAVALNSSIFNGARLIGPAVAGVILIRWGATACFVANALSYLPVMVVLLTIHPRTAAVDAASRRGGLHGGLRYLAGEPVLRTLLILVAVASIFGFSLGTLLPVFAGDVFGRQADGYGQLVAASGTGALTGALLLVFWGSRRRPKPFLASGLGLLGLGVAAVGLAPTFGVALGLAALAGFGMVVFHASANTTLQLTTPDELRGRILGVWGLAFLGLSPIGQLQIGYLAEHLGPRPAVLLAGTVVMLASLAAWRWIPASAGVVLAPPPALEGESLAPPL